jgi:putative ABC transport system permease protein
MLTWIKIAVRNILKNGRRSFYTILAIAMGFAAVNIFGGFTDYIFANLRDASIYNQGDGHLTIFKKGFLDEGQLDPIRYLLTESELETVRNVAMNTPHVLLVTPKLQISGLISNGTVSTIFYANGTVPSEKALIRTRARGMISKIKLFEGKPLEDDVTYGVGLSAGLAKKLNLPLDSTGTAMAVAVNGMVNALDIQVFQTFESVMEVLNDKMMEVPLRFAQSLYDTSSVDRICVLLEDNSYTEPLRQKLEQALKDKGLDVEIRTWVELSSFYRKVKDMFNIIFFFIFVIVLIIVVMSIINTISMSVMERTREIGTLRALGLKRRGIINLFAVESAMLGILGSSLGIFLTALGWAFIRILQPTWIPPHITKRLPLEIYIVPDYLLMSFLFLAVLSILAAMFPARKAAFKSINDALGHV